MGSSSNNNMVDFATLVKNTFRKLQLQAQCAILDREITKRQRSFGVELYGLIETQRQELRQSVLSKDDTGNPQQAANDVESMMKVFQGVENDIRVPLEVCQKEVREMETSQPPSHPYFIQRRKEQFGVTIWPTIEERLDLPESLV